MEIQTNFIANLFSECIPKQFLNCGNMDSQLQDAFLSPNRCGLNRIFPGSGNLVKMSKFQSKESFE